MQRGLVDCFGVLFAGREEPVVQLARSLVAQPGEGPSRILGDGARCSAPDAALVDAVASHALDYDDTGLDGHPSAILVSMREQLDERVADIERIEVEIGRVQATMLRSHSGSVDAHRYAFLPGTPTTTITIGGGNQRCAFAIIATSGPVRCSS